MTKVNSFKISPVDEANRRKLPLNPGATVRVIQRVPDKDGKFRLQAYEGLVIARKHGAEAGATFTVRRVASGVGMEKIFPLYSPMIDKIEVLREVKVRRSKLYYIRDKAAREIRRRMRKIIPGRKNEEPDELVDQVTTGIETEPVRDDLEEINLETDTDTFAEKIES
ncbi:MAG: 50S ribosomal protein L19 [Candidatus Vogelbacteria bacterium CG10_big_fil_rev_8_21_14_0_10_49_38]|uniref:50S ribosomal protein L19 n=1 Tax=Candidatus Vogelbacteria bacterium CG10_big_fil_rev_8_21_14_0_10_49_38 TaxID=1975043 RepID=A0A2H0RIA7_9BACT|nr:MAG: 50S ribosomal protein L19 [bacterium CG10_49_38]PIR46223.1 MAG: 50S ribosomal protein L19 [Candidatus Vogelbacteria bacterium CG10_big_fil_rev_8_21_14_0_10_49_38]